MDDAAVHSLPDDPRLLKTLLIEHHERIAQLQEQTQRIELENQQIKLEIERIESLRSHQIAELELDKLRLQQQLMVAMKKLYGPRADRLAGTGRHGPDAAGLCEGAGSPPGRSG